MPAFPSLLSLFRVPDAFRILLALLAVPVSVLAQGVVDRPAGAPGQTAQEEGECEIPHHGGFQRIPLTERPGDFRMSMRYPTFACPGGIIIMADSAEIFELTHYTRLFRNVVFRDQDRDLRADEAQYFEIERRLEASGNVVLNDHSGGSTITGAAMRLLRAGPQRPEDELTVSGGTPHATLYPTRLPAPPEPEEALPDTAGQAGMAPAFDSAAALDTLDAPPDPSVARGDPIPVGVPDSLIQALPDTGGVVAPDTTLRAPPDTTGAVPPDSLIQALPDPSAAFRPDSAQGVPPDTAEAVPPDSAVQALPDTGVAPVLDTLGIPPDTTPPVRLPTLPTEEARAIILAEMAPDPVQPDTTEERVPYEIDARRIFLEGSRYFRAVGSVVITRDSLTAVADSVEYDQDVGALFLSNDARVTTATTDLAAESIRLDIPQDEVREILARGEAVLVGEDIRLLAPVVSLFFTEGQMERLVAVRDPVADSIALLEDPPAEDAPGAVPVPTELGVPTEAPDTLAEPAHPDAAEMGLVRFPDRPHAMAQDFVLQGDSLEVFAPQEILSQVKAMGRARGESVARDSLNSPDTPDFLKKDWLEGDTVVAMFEEEQDSLATLEDPDRDPNLDPEDAPLLPQRQEAQADTTGAKYRLERLVALGSARSLYRLAASDSTMTEPAAHYVMGDAITIFMSQGEVERMEVLGATRGIHIEPEIRRAGGGGGVGGVGDPLPPTGGGIRTGGGSPDPGGGGKGPVPNPVCPARAGGGRR